MTKNQLLLFGFLISLTSAQGQKIQLGLSASLNKTFFHKGQSEYDNFYFQAKSKMGTGLAVPAYYKFSDNWTLKSGIGYQNKKYHFEQNKFDFPNVAEGSSYFYYQIKFKTVEVPLIICYSSADTNKTFKIEYKIGCVLSFNSPHTMTHGYQLFHYSGTDTVNFKFAVPENWAKYFSPDLYISIGVLKSKGLLRHHELSISYQYSFIKSTKYAFFSELATNSLTKEYNAIVTPNLSYVALTYTCFPKWLNILKEKPKQ